MKLNFVIVFILGIKHQMKIPGSNFFIKKLDAETCPYCFAIHSINF